MDGIPNAGARVTGKPVDIARNELLALVPTIIADHPEFADAIVLWCDDDALWFPGTVTAMMAKLAMLGEDDLLSAWCSARTAHSPAMAFENDPTNEGMVRHASSLQNARPGDIIEADSLGMHFLVHRSSLLSKLGPNPFTVLEHRGVKTSEDISFCRRVKAIGGRCFISYAPETTVLHVDTTTGLAYTPYCSPLWIEDGRITPVTNVAQIAATSKGAQITQLNDSAILINAPTRSYGESVDATIETGTVDDGRDSPDDGVGWGVSHAPGAPETGATIPVPFLGS